MKKTNTWRFGVWETVKPIILWQQLVWWSGAKANILPTYIYHKNLPNVGKYTSPMDPIRCSDLFSRLAFRISGKLFYKFVARIMLLSMQCWLLRALVGKVSLSIRAATFPFPCEEVGASTPWWYWHSPEGAYPPARIHGRLTCTSIGWTLDNTSKWQILPALTAQSTTRLNYNISATWISKGNTGLISLKFSGISGFAFIS